MHDRAREIVIERAGLGTGAGPEMVLKAARELGLDEPEARSVAGLDLPRTDDDVLVTGRALTKLGSR